MPGGDARGWNWLSHKNRPCYRISFGVSRASGGTAKASGEATRERALVRSRARPQKRACSQARK